VLMYASAAPRPVPCRNDIRLETAAVVFSSMSVVSTYAEVDVLGTYSTGPLVTHG
jgi:hypothetical protein